MGIDLVGYLGERERREGVKGKEQRESQKVRDRERKRNRVGEGEKLPLQERDGKERSRREIC